RRFAWPLAIVDRTFRHDPPFTSRRGHKRHLEAPLADPIRNRRRLPAYPRHPLLLPRRLRGLLADQRLKRRRFPPRGFRSILRRSLSDTGCKPACWSARRASSSRNFSNRRASRTTSLAVWYRPLRTFSLTSASSS